MAATHRVSGAPQTLLPLITVLGDFMKLFNTSLTRRLVGALALGLGMGWHVAQAQQAPQLPPGYKAEYKLSLVVGTAFPWGKGGEIWSNLVKERTNGRINIKLYPGVSLVGGDQTREFTAIRQGVIDMAIGSSINWSPQVKELNLFSLPFLIKDYASLDALTGGEVGKDVFSILDKAGVMPLAWGENGFRELTNSKRDIASPADLKGLKIRVVGSPLFLEMFTALGANPVQMSWADAQPALSSGAIDGQENPVSIFTAAKLHTVGQKHVTMWGYMIDPLVFVVNKDVWNSWTPEDREIVRKSAVDAGKQEIALARAGLVEAGRPLLKDIEGLGVKITTLNAAQREQFVNATRSVYNKWKPQVGAPLVDKAEKALAAVK
jgi:tripartite ATP-independent transporter DctP family solute receptor